ncbi:MAG: hypothetical protein GY757_28895 [bacterium]|nr:hypothetical protein [bacterium]
MNKSTPITCRGGIVMLLLFLAVVLSYSQASAANAGGDSGMKSPPDSNRVVLEHQKLLQEYGFQKKDRKKESSKRKYAAESAPQEENGSFFDFLKSLEKLSLPIVILIIAIVLLLLYFLFVGMPRFFPGDDEYKSGGVTEPQRVSPVRKTAGLYESALNLAKKGEYGKALILLHKSTVSVLQQKGVIPRDENFTNNEIKGLIKKGSATLYNPFNLIAAAAERAAFNKENPEAAVFSNLIKLYDGSFSKIGRGNNAGKSQGKSQAKAQGKGERR